MLSSKVVYSNQQQQQQYGDVSLSLQNPRSGTLRREASGGKAVVNLSYPSSSRVEHIATISGGSSNQASGARASSQERIVDTERFGMEASDVDLETLDPVWHGISRTVEVDVVRSSRAVVEPRLIPD
jgi:hypothetical protein